MRIVDIGPDGTEHVTELPDPEPQPVDQVAELAEALAALPPAMLDTLTTLLRNGVEQP